MSSKVAGLRNIVSVVVFFVVTQCSVVPHTDVDIDKEEYSLTIRMPDVVSDRADDLVCTGVKLDPAEAYLIRFKPHAKKETAHHMMVYGCHQPASHDASWHCFNTDNSDENGVCGDGERQVLFAWAMDAPDKSLPEGVGIRVSGRTNIKYLVVQLHYATAFRPGITDNSGITIDFTKKRPEQIANYLVLGNFGRIPPKQKAFYMESSCVFGQPFTIYPIGYRTHSHNLGYVTSGYRIRDGKWTEIGRMSPQLPQTFYPVTNPGMDIRYGDVLVSRCTMNSMARAEVTNIGPTNHDEMCNFYIMYSTFNPEQQPTNYCFKDANNYTWAVDETVDLSDIPDNLSSLEGIPGAETVEKYFKTGAQEHHHKG
ncbi:peptidylglycine alpha-hydroxylating monooxygenase [Biomphalaria glabrata]|nr:peptidylglycine alpha-hydroxylating monooxygenase [Biomphalaria glabrata]